MKQRTGRSYYEEKKLVKLVDLIQKGRVVLFHSILSYCKKKEAIPIQFYLGRAGICRLRTDLIPQEHGECFSWLSKTAEVHHNIRRTATRMNKSSFTFSSIKSLAGQKKKKERKKQAVAISLSNCLDDFP